MRRVWLVALSFVLAAPKILAGQATLEANQISPEGLSRDQAKAVLSIVLKHQRHDLNKTGMSVEELHRKDGSDPHPGYYDFGLSYDTPEAGATQVLGAYAVSRFTGDVWELNLCKRFSPRDLKKLQKIIMARTGRSFSSEKMERIGLGCTSV